MIDIAMHINAVRQRIRSATELSGRTQEPLLLAISKTRSPTELLCAYQAGILHFGENYLQEALEKINALQAYPLIWHFTGPIQSNKTRLIAENFSWVHSIDRIKIAQRLNEQRTVELGKLQVCIQVNIDREKSKAGVLPEALPELAHEINALSHLQLRGLMALPAAEASPAQHQTSFARLADLLTLLQRQSLPMDTLSMGMSDDLELAIAEGATIVRVGSALFGTRIRNNLQ